MTRKDYIAIAEALRDALNLTSGNCHHRDGVRDAAEKIANAMQDDNPSFDRAHFLAVVRGERELTSRPPRHARSFTRRAVLGRERTGGHEVVNGICQKCDAGDSTSVVALSDSCPS